MKYKNTVLITIAVAVLFASVVVIVLFIQGVKPVSKADSPGTRTTFEALNIKPGDIDCINISSKSKGTATITDSKTLAEVIGIVNTSLTDSRTVANEIEDYITIYFYKGSGLLGSIRIYQKDCKIGRDICMSSNTAFDTEKLMSYIKAKPVGIRPKEYEDLMNAAEKLTTLTESASLMGGMKDYVNKLEEYFSTKAYWEMTVLDSALVDIACIRPSQNVLVVNYLPDFKALGETSPKWCLVFYDDGRGKIKGCRTLEDEDILITDAKIFEIGYLLLAGRCSDASTAVIGYEIKNGELVKTPIVEECSSDEFKVSSDMLLSNKKLSPVSFIIPKGDTSKSGTGFRGFMEEGFSVMFSEVVIFSFDESKKLFTVKGTSSAGEWSKLEAVNLYKNKYFKDMAPSEFPVNIEYEEIDSGTVTDMYGQNIRVSICYILPDGFVSEKTGEYEIDGCVLNIDNWSTPSITGIYAVINDCDILTLDDAVYSRKYSINMQELYKKLPESFRDLKPINSGQALMKQLEDGVRSIENELNKNDGKI